MRLYLVTPVDLTMPGIWFYWAHNEQEALAEHYRNGFDKEVEEFQAEAVWASNMSRYYRGYVIREDK